MAFSGQEVSKFSSFEVKETCSDSEKSDSDLHSEWDDSEDDPDYDILEDTHGKLSNLSIDKKKKGRVTEGKDPMTEADPEEREITAAAPDEKDEENFDQVQKTIEEKRVFFRYCLLEVDSCIHVLKNFFPKPFCNAEAETSNIRNDSRIRVLKNSSPKPFCNAEAETTGLIEKLKVDQCKLYLRKNGLRLTGNKDVLVQRIKEHTEIMNGGGKKKYPPSSFVLNCKGDACTGDVVLFEQNVYEMFNLASRSASGPPCGKRTVAGRIVKESYGAAKQQHTFTIEVLWSKGEKPLPPLHPLLIKGRNLYRLKILRQRWDDEGERQKILTEKHTRGSVARADREARIQEKEKKKTILKNRVNNRSQSHQTHSNKAKSQYDQPLESDQLINSAKPAIPSQTSDLPNLKKRPSEVQLHGSSAIAAFAGKLAAAGTQQCVKTADTKRMAMGPQLIGKSFDSVKPSFPGQKPVLSFDRTEVETESYQQKIYHWQKRQASQNPYYDKRRAELSEKYIWPDINSRETQAAFGRDSNSNGFAGMTHHTHRQPFTSTNHLLPLKPRRTQNQVCRHYAKGRCNYGENCKFLHHLRDQIIVFGETERIGGCLPHYPPC